MIKYNVIIFNKMYHEKMIIKINPTGDSSETAPSKSKRKAAPTVETGETVAAPLPPCHWLMKSEPESRFENGIDVKVQHRWQQAGVGLFWWPVTVELHSGAVSTHYQWHPLMYNMWFYRWPLSRLPYSQNVWGSSPSGTTYLILLITSHWITTIGCKKWIQTWIE